MFKVAVGHGIDPDSLGAIAEAIEQCQQTLAGDIPQAGILVAAIDFDHASILKYVRQVYPDLILVGGTSVGEMSSTMGFQEDSLSLMLFCSDEVTFSAGMGRGVSKDTAAAATAAIQTATTTHQHAVSDIKLCYTLCEGLAVDGADLVTSLRHATGQRVPIFGGLTGDDYRFEHTYQFFGTDVLEDTVVVLTFFGKLKVSFGVGTGQRPIGKKAIATKSIGNTLYEIDEKPTKKFYEPYFGEQEVRLYSGTTFSGPLAVYEPGAHNFYVRTPTGESNGDGSVDYFGSIPEGSTLQITDSDCESLIQSAQDAFSKAKFAYPGTTPSAVIMNSCVSRMKNLGTQVDQEHQVIADIAGKDLPNMGFYAYGEISPFTRSEGSHFHNETFTALLIGT